MIRGLRYAVEEALASLWRGRQAGVLSTATISVALFVLGGFLLVTSNLERLVAEWSNAAGMSVYLQDDVTEQQRADIERLVAPGDVIADHEYVSKAEALVRFKRTFGDLAPTVDTAGDNPLPASFEVRLRTANTVDELASRLRQAPGVVDVRYDRYWLERLLAAVSVVRGIGLILGSVLTIAAALTVANVVRLALNARRTEIDIMELVGAPQSYIRGPFVMEGVLQGGIGALLALGALAGGFFIMRARYLVPLASAVNLSAVKFLPLELCVLLVLGGMGVGCVGGLLAAWSSR